LAEELEDAMRLPKRLYKYRRLTVQTLAMVVRAQQHFADPSRFNDPFDTRPSLKVDVDSSELKRILAILIEKRTAAEMRVAAQAMKFVEGSTDDWVEEHSRSQAEECISDIEYGATIEDCDSDATPESQLQYRIELELLRGHDKGIVSLAERDDCPLMWGHYGDQHRGICLGYSVSEKFRSDIRKVDYGGSRLVSAIDIAAMLDGDDRAGATVRDSMLLRKAESWSYEKEWRLIGRIGTQASPLELEEVIFGVRCEAPSKFMVMKALEDVKRQVEFYEMREERGTFDLKKYALSYNDEIFGRFPRSAPVSQHFRKRSREKD